MMIKQQIPDGDFCGSYSRENGKEKMCIFIDRGANFENTDLSWQCRRNPNVTLGSEIESGPSRNKNIVKCRACLKEKVT
jgi:hypothetical protein